MNKYFYITTPIYYVNDSPHIGHAYTSLACDVIARYKRLDNYNVKFLTGTDEHGQKVEKSAELMNKTPQDFVDEVSQRFRDLTKTMNFSNDDFIRTTEERHIKTAITIWNKLKENNYIYLGKYAGWYSVRDEAFYNESELVEGKAPTGAPVEWVEESSYFFALSKFSDKLLEFYEQNPDFIKPASRRNEVISFVKSGLHDLSISRTSFKWGIKIPGDEAHIMYVWLDALTNYLSAITTEEGIDYNYWNEAIHVVGKDILRFHAIYWPAFLMAADIPPPKQIIAHGWWTNEGQKISKSLGNVIDPNKLVAEFGLDQTRYFLMREVPFGNDGNFSRTAMINRINSELANNIGNLAQRSLSLIVKNCDAKVPVTTNAYSNPLLIEAESLREAVLAHLDLFEFNQILELLINFANNANAYIDKEAPWALAKTDITKMNEVLYVLAESLRYIGILLAPFMPGSMDKLLSILGVPENERGLAMLNREYALREGAEINALSPIFPRFIG